MILNPNESIIIIQQIAVSNRQPRLQFESEIWREIESNQKFVESNQFKEVEKIISDIVKGKDFVDTFGGSMGLIDNLNKKHHQVISDMINKANPAFMSKLIQTIPEVKGYEKPLGFNIIKAHMGRNQDA